ncbi:MULTISPECIES: DUF2865 domain-containing protein [Methylobacterium]|uniref:DUF2865 domain-containing protein n=5 Tax=Pseudomonadota TaxID=1224 RepID=A0ABQ4SPF8_9HYPH|nr:MULTISPECIES: DUF2865 domain-containing protein [Methylobacterium]PIU04395.1 MAG: hypothetical protein COT56_20290 [Methylobacterium sp. CG09_land_8_20_14_0_10_71_15]PIU13087.1 MAG: hypothetical protein COT28_12550 [Methylobacterium sp. CG08_land_8_20_14_0_20_71_15]GBU18385.1 hypothetical protein AwMethylo_26000 [Methylobacterium sp.]GJE04962.1 hypothetical protein AOPFMNJM_0254 [Methylobacterium jeotgali]
MSRVIPNIAHRLLRAAVLALGAGLALAGPASAQSPAPSPNLLACQRYKAELASVSDTASVARALQSEVGRLEAYYRTLSCEGGKFLFFDTRPPQCGAVEQRIRALNAGYGADNGEVAAARRRQLQAQVASACTGVQETAAGPASEFARGGAQVICVRTCDGAYFPMPNLPEGRSGADEMCHALCPGTEAAAYSMPHGDGALKQAAAVKGNRSYASLANAFKFQKTFVPNCSCKKEGQTWAQSLVKAESMLVRHKGDIFVTPLQAEALSRPKVRLTLVGRADKTAASLAADAAVRAGDAPAPEAPKAAEAGAEGQRPSVRIIAPGIVATPVR